MGNRKFSVSFYNCILLSLFFISINTIPTMPKDENSSINQQNTDNTSDDQCSSSQLVNTDDTDGSLPFKCQVCFNPSGIYQSCTKIDCNYDVDTYQCNSEQNYTLTMQACGEECCPGLIVGQLGPNNTFTQSMWQQCVGVLNQSHEKTQNGALIGGIVGGIMVLGFMIWAVVILVNKSKKKSKGRSSQEYGSDSSPHQNSKSQEKSGDSEEEQDSEESEKKKKKNVRQTKDKKKKKRNKMQRQSIGEDQKQDEIKRAQRQKNDQSAQKNVVNSKNQVKVIRNRNTNFDLSRQQYDKKEKETQFRRGHNLTGMPAMIRQFEMTPPNMLGTRRDIDDPLM